MTHQDFLGFFSVACASVGYGSYIRSILQKKTKPHLFSWGVWSLLMAIVFFAQVSKGAGAGAWVMGFSACCCLLITLMAIKNGEKNITKSDWLALAGALITIPVWYMTHDPLWAVLLATVIDGLAYYPTFRKSYGKPYEENVLTYSVDIFKWIVAFFALSDFSATTLIYPVFIFTSNCALVAMIMWRRLATARQSEGKW
jgi:hypothetical protein